MDEYTADAFANRDEPIPLLTVSYSDVDASSSEFETDSKRKRLRKSLSPTRLKEKVRDLNNAHHEQRGTSPDGKVSLQDRLFAKVLQQVIPSEDIDDDLDTPVDRRSSQYVTRPSFSLPLMTNNFRRFNARIGIVFVFQNRLIRLFTWRTPSHTLSFLATYTFICLDPYLLIILPLAITLLFIMVPAFLSRHPPPPPQNSTSRTTPYYSTYTGPALAPARTIKPAAETSKDFFRNMRDLQNAMADFSTIHDALVAQIAPATNFSDEILSSTIFLYLTLLIVSLFITAQLLPWRFILLGAGYIVTVSMHPRAQEWLIKQQKKMERRRALALANPSTSKHSNTFTSIPGLPFALPPIPIQLHKPLTTLSSITVSTIPETREVEIFELQHRPLSSSLHPTSGAAQEWQPHLFTPTPYDPLSPARIAGDRPHGTRFFEDVQPPEGWEWDGKKWQLDLEAGEWVSERLVVGVEYDVLNQGDREDDGSGIDDDDNYQTGSAADAGLGARKFSVNGEFGGWVWDLPPAPGAGGRDEEVWLAYGDYEIPSSSSLSKEEKKRMKKERKAKSKDWEEAVRYGGQGRTGEWRRRRWVRTVNRKIVGEFPF